MTQIDQIIADALAGSPETHVAILAREVVRLRKWPAVVVPEPTMFDVNREYFENFANVFTSAKEREAHKTGFLAGADWFRARAIPADRELGEGVVGMPQVKRKCQNDDEDAIETLTLCGYGEQAELLEDALRANQGEDDHG